MFSIVVSTLGFCENDGFLPPIIVPLFAPYVLEPLAFVVIPGPILFIAKSRLLLSYCMRMWFLSRVFFTLLFAELGLT